MKWCIINGFVIDPASGIAEKIDIRIENGVITQMAKKVNTDDAEIMDAKGLTIAPGFVDMHCHLREPGFEYKEDIYSGTRAAARGGFTSICCMANTNPVADNAPIIYYIKQKSKEVGAVHVYPIGAITKKMEGLEMAELASMKAAGAIAVSDDGHPVKNAQLMRLALQYAKGNELLVISHPEDMELVNDGVMNEGYYSTVLGLRGISRSAEEVMIARELILAETLKSRIHIAHVSTKNGVQLIREAKARGVFVTCETAPHYVSATDAWVEGYNTNTKVNPPLRTDEDVMAIKQGLKDGTIDCIATDHAPHHQDEKQVEYPLALSGISGFETAFSLCYTNLVKTGDLTLSALIEKMSGIPAKILGISAGSLKVGDKADITIIDTEKSYTISANDFVSKGKNTPFDGVEVTGQVIHTFVDGKLIIKDTKVIV